MGLRQVIVALVVFLVGAGPATADDSALHEKGFWTVGRGDAGAKGCVASVVARDETMLLIQVAPGHVDFVVGKKKPVRRGKRGILTIDAASFDFEPDVTDEGLLFFEDANGRGLAALRTAHNLAVRVDGREVLEVSVENTGLEGALDAVIACSQGKSGWWGPGVGAERISDGPVPNKAADGIVMNKEGLWGIATGAERGVCVAQASVDGGRHLQILAALGQLGLAVGSDGEDLPRGRRGRVETDSYTAGFRPQYGADSYMASAEPLDSKAIAALSAAKWLRVSVDGRALVDVALEGSGFAEVLNSVAACSRSERGWWGEGAKQP
jgi:hypothetical protein